MFVNAKDTYVCIPILAKAKQPERIEVSRIPSLSEQDISKYVEANKFTIPHQRLSTEAWSLISDQEAAVFEKIVRAGTPLGNYVNGKMYYGVKTGFNEAFLIDSATRKALIDKNKNSAELIKPVLGGENIRRYALDAADTWLIFTRRGIDIQKYPAIKEHLSRWKAELTPKNFSTDKSGRKPGNYAWYEIQDDVAYFEIFDKPKIIFPDICKAPRFFLDHDGNFLTNTAYALGVEDPYLLGILNSRLFWFAISNISIPFGVRAGEFRYRLVYQYMEKVPIRVIDSENRADCDHRSALVKMVNQTIKLHKQGKSINTPHAKTALERQITAIDRQIDDLIYELYGLTNEEKNVVEGSRTVSPSKCN